MISSLHLGHVHIPMFGICAALGLMAALTLCTITARLVRLDPTVVWDAVLVLVFTAFVVSRLLLIAGSWRSFLAAPLLILSLPTLNDTGVLLTAAFAYGYLRWRKLPLLGFLDAVAPCAALIWAFLSLGRALDGTRDGMPTRFFLAIGGLQPVELYTLIAAMVLCGLLIRALSRPTQRGLVFARALVLAGIAVFVLDFLRVPGELFVPAILDPRQWIGLAMLTVGAALFIALPATGKTGNPDAV